MSSKFVLAIDQGTTGSTVNLIDHQGQSIINHNEEHPQYFPKPGWVEHDPEAIWLSVQKSIKVVQTLAAKRGLVEQFNAATIAAIGITNQRETVVVWDRKTGKPLHNAIVWQCRRTTEMCQSLKKKGHEPLFRKRTGLVLDPYFSGTKMRWLLDHIVGLRSRAHQGEICIGTIDSFVLWRLTHGRIFATDVSNASRTLLCNIKSCDWDLELLKILHVPREVLPEIRSSSEVYETTNKISLDGAQIIGDGIPVAALIGDQQGALFGQGCFQPGQAKCTFGTGSFILLNTGKDLVRSKHGLLTTVAWQIGNKSNTVYALEGGAFICGAAVQWLRDGLGIINKSDEMEALARSVADSGGVHFVPALTGLGAPYWRPDARGIWTGLTRGTTRGHIARATLEAMALQNVDILAAMAKDTRKKLKTLRVDGGAARNQLLLEIQADLLGATVERPQSVAATSAGAAYLAGLAVGFWKNIKELDKVTRIDSSVSPKLATRTRAERLRDWHLAVKKC